MPHPVATLHVSGRFRHHARGGRVLVLDEPIVGHHTFLSGVLELDGSDLPVRILTFDDVTVLQPTTRHPRIRAEERWQGTLRLPHGQRARTIPHDLARSARERGTTFDSLSSADLTFALTYLGEATTPAIRQARLDVIVAALPEAGNSA